ncbi:class D sortase [Fictibacillus sp. UD]|uniref:class D sortase n=1 Tax=Fictibacillus sp. UD TaxID=3038777 RepID=UPI003745336F
MSAKTVKRAAISAVILGIALLVIPLLTNWKTENEQKALEREWSALNHSYQNPFTLPEVKAIKADKTNQEEKQEPEEIDKSIAVEKGVIGKITIETINLETMIVPGVAQKDLKNAVGWMTSTSFPGDKGNSVLAGHRSHTYGQFFHRLNEVKTGDAIKIETTSGTIVYKVYDMVIVNPEDLSVLNAAKEEELTLITCEPLYSDKYRLIVKAERLH